MLQRKRTYCLFSIIEQLQACIHRIKSAWSIMQTKGRISALLTNDEVGNYKVMQLFEFFIVGILWQVGSAQLSISLAFDQQSATLYSNSHHNKLFVLAESILQCASTLYEYSQSAQQYQAGTASLLNIAGNSQQLSLSVSTKYGHFSPLLNASSCSSASCMISLKPSCPSQLNNINYFDIIMLQIQPIGVFSFYFNCNASFNTTYFEYGGLILICLATLILMVAVNVSRWNAFNGYGIKYQYKMILFISSSVLTVGLLSFYRPAVASIILDIGNTVSIIASVSVLAIEVLYALKRQRLQRVVLQWKGYQLRVLDIVGVLTSVPVVVAWWLLEDNWIFSDVMSVLLIISVIKVFKFVSLKVALTAYLVMVSIYSAADIFISIKFQNQYHRYFLFRASTPYQLTFPVLTPAFGERCTWVSITTIAFPGLLVSYLRRFDRSRSTRIYLITAISTYFLGSVIWWVASTFSFYPLPFDAFCEPIMIIAFTMFAFKRKELRTLWEGKFFDEEFSNKDHITALANTIAEETPQIEQFKQEIGELFLFFEMKEDSELDHNDTSKINNDQL